MGYTVLGFFEKRENAQEAIGKLVKEGFDDERVDFSPYRTEGTYVAKDYDFDEDEKSSGFWDWLFGDDDAEKEKHSRVGARSMVVSVYADSKDEAEQAASVMDDYGALDVDRRNQELGFDENTSDRTNGKEEHGENIPVGREDTYSQDPMDNLDSPEEINDTPIAVDENVKRSDDMNYSNKDDDTIDVIEEDMNVEKRKEETGGVTVRSRIIEKPVEENVRLRNERVYVTRNPVDKAVEGGDPFQDKTVEMKETSEKAVVNKKARVVEEVSLNKEVSEQEETISDTVRETEIEVDKKR